jgi:hypothetical protein
MACIFWGVLGSFSTLVVDIVLLDVFVSLSFNSSGSQFQKNPRSLQAEHLVGNARFNFPASELDVLDNVLLEKHPEEFSDVASLKTLKVVICSRSILFVCKRSTSIAAVFVILNVSELG